MCLRCLLILLLLDASLCCSQEIPQLADLTAAEFAALERASEGSVTGTISFLASDELAGRGTPSKELTIATAYVASRLRAAGAVGLGPQGSFFIETSIDTTQTAPGGCQLAVEVGRLLRTSLIEGGSQAFTYQGKVTALAEDRQLPNDFSGPVAIRLGDSEGDGPPTALQLRREARRLAAIGATAIVVEAPPESALWDFAAHMQANPRIDSARSRFELPIVVVEAEALEPEQEISLSLPANVNAASKVRNVVGLLRGSDPQLAEQALVFSAHLDHLGRAEGPDPVYNGADDDASGVTAVLTLADVFGALQPAPRRSLVFVTFWGEERGLLGSKEFVSNSPWPLENIVADINIEMIGRPEEGALNKCWMTGWDQSDLGQLIAQGSRRLGVETFEHPSYSAKLYRASDNYSFVQQGVIAHSFSAGSLHADYHQPSDEWQKLNLPHMTQVIRGLYAGVLPIAQGTVTPQKIAP